jgi:hypothetical protein
MIEAGVHDVFQEGSRTCRLSDDVHNAGGHQDERRVSRRGLMCDHVMS